MRSSMELVACTVTLHLDTYSISAGKVLWNSRGREGGRDPPRSAGVALTVNPVFSEELVMSDLKNPTYGARGRNRTVRAASSALTKLRCSAGRSDGRYGQPPQGDVAIRPRSTPTSVGQPFFGPAHSNW